MAVKIISRTYTGLPCGEAVEILADTEADIQALGDEINDGYQTVKAAAGSTAYTADLAVIYQKAPSAGWVKCLEG